jgi:hypothetical protein
MKSFRSHSGHSPVIRVACAAVCLFPTLLLAHPGHYHPDETDEFDFLRATFFHSHGRLDYLLATVAVAGIAVAWFSARPAVRISALVGALGSIALLPIF